ncbi:uncharacterized protein LOC122650206 isoform X4 [Telopea speciosissima]|uniref:uncharacterized protein LOC122650206 isoform X4 n=1 Tax=Telopea speciosissima TaxID=54955 RepID=UPI001CC567CA|nr:uncharacterized protein LOC122650206 isoform X4 [Telopea speciosissima]
MIISGDLSGFEDGSDGTDNGASERSSQVPVVGMSFKSENEAYKFYNAYARTKGFGVKKLQVDRARKDGIQGETVNRVFTCVKERLRDDSYKGYRDKEVQYQDTTRMDCKAAMQIKKCPSGWVVTKFIEEHNHELVPSLWYLQRTFDVLVHIAKESKERCNVAVDCLKEAIQKCSHIEVRSTADPDANQGGGPNSQQESIRFINFDYTSFSDPAKTKGWPTSSKPKVWYDQHASKNRNKCGNCDELGHNLRTCPLPPNPQRDKSGKAITPATSKPKAWYDQVDNHNKCGNCDALGHNLRTCPLPLNPERSKSQKRHATQSPSNLLGTSSNHRQGELRNEFGIDSRGVGVLATQAALQASSVTVCHPRNN